jgi:hypothetical protein
MNRKIASIASLTGLTLSIFLSACTQEDSGSKSINPDTEIVTENAPQNNYDLYATMLAFNPNEGFGGPGELTDTLEEEGWLALSSDETLFTKYLSTMKGRFESALDMAKAANFSMDREIPGAFTWNVIEPEKGEGYHWDVSDQVVQAANEAGMSVSALIQPFAAWDQDSIPANCTAIDFAYYDYKAGTPTDWEAYQAYLSATVERYDGDGKDDMPGLTVPIKYWEIGNEYDGTCGGDLNEAENYYELMQNSSEAIRSANPSAKVVTMGALELSSDIRDIRGFWEDFFALGGGDTIDIFNFHYNTEKFGIASSSSEFEEHLDFFNEVMEEYDSVKPMWITEFGTYSGTPSSNRPSGGYPTGNVKVPSSPSQSEEEQAAWYFRYSMLAFEAGVEKIFVDLYGPDNSTIGGSSLYNPKGEARAFVTTLQTIAELLDGFSSVEELEEGQFRFETEEGTVYALWSGEVPSELNGDVEVFFIDGSSEKMASDELVFSEENPILVK